MKTRRLILIALVLLASIRPALAQPALPEPGPENGGLRMRLTVVPNADAGTEGYDVRVELLNVSNQPIILRADWRGRGGSDGDLQAYVEAATSIETYPAITPWIGQVMQGTAPSPQPEEVLAAGGTLTVQWRTAGRRLKNKVTDPNAVQNPDFPTPGLYAVHAVLVLPITDRTVLLRSNEQLVPIGGSLAMPKHTFGTLSFADAATKTGGVNLGSLHRIEVGDEFQMQAGFRESWKLTVTKVEPWSAFGTLEPIRASAQNDSARVAPFPERGIWVTLIPRK